MSDNLPYCVIQGNADIAGIGIRASIYIQACLGPLCVLFSIIKTFYLSEKDRDKLAAEQCQLLDEISLTLLLTGFALTTSTIIEAKTNDSGLTPYHTLIVLNLSWLNNISGFSLCLWSSIIKSNAHSKSVQQLIISFVQTCWAFTLHCIIMSIMGIWFWASPDSFSHFSYDRPCLPMTYFWLFSRIPLPNDTLRIFSLIAYSAISIPVVNIIIHLCPWILWFLVANTIDDERNWLIIPMLFGLLVIIIGPTIFFIISTEMLIAANNEFVDHNIEERWTFGQTLAILLAAVSVLLILGHIKRQWREARRAMRDESEKGIRKQFGGIAAMLLATQGRKFKVRDIGPQIVPSDD